MSSEALTTNPPNSTFATRLTNAEISEATALLDLESINLGSKYLLQNYRGISKEEVRVSNRYYSQYRNDYSIENLA